MKTLSITTPVALTSVKSCAPAAAGAVAGLAAAVAGADVAAEVVGFAVGAVLADEHAPVTSNAAVKPQINALLFNGCPSYLKWSV